MRILPLSRWWRWKKTREPEKWVAIRCKRAMWLYCPRSLVRGAPAKVHSSFDRHCYVNTRQALLTSGVGIHTFPPANYGIAEWKQEVSSSQAHSVPVLCFVLYHDHILTRVDDSEKCCDDQIPVLRGCRQFAPGRVFQGIIGRWRAIQSQRPQQEIKSRMSGRCLGVKGSAQWS